jgi:CRISPR-associated protein Cmr4
MYNNKAYIIKTKTNLHVGSGDINFGIVDNEVQRDTITNLPVINASSLK